MSRKGRALYGNDETGDRFAATGKRRRAERAGERITRTFCSNEQTWRHIMRRYSVRRVRAAWTNGVPTWEVIDRQHPDHQPAWFTSLEVAIRYRDDMEESV